MSRIGKLPVPLPSGVDVNIDGQSVTVKGPKGTLSHTIVAPIEIEKAEDGTLQVTRPNDERAAKERHKALPAQLLQDATQFIPPAVFARAAQMTFSLAATRRPVWNLVISNVPGPQFPLYMAGARLVANYPISVITDGMGLNITVMSYDGHLDFGIVADREQMRDVWKLIEWLHESLNELAPRTREQTAEQV